MIQIENLIFVILALCLIVCALFWYQVTKLQLPNVPNPQAQPIQKIPQQPNTAEITDTLPPALSIAVLPPIELPKGRDTFTLPWRKDDGERAPAPIEIVEEPLPVLSTIFWSPNASQVIIDGEILALGEVDTKSRFQVETIRPQFVRILRMSDNKLLWLTLNFNQTDTAFQPMIQR